MGKNITDLDSKSLDKFIGKDSVVLDFWAPWCGPCKVLEPVVDSVAKEFDGTVKFGKVNIDKNQDLAQRFQVMSIPTMIFLKDGEQVERFSGAMSEDDLKKKVDDSF